VNHRFGELFGVTPADIRGRQFASLFAKDGTKQALEALTRSQHDGEHLLVREDGTTFYCRLLGRRLDEDSDDSGSIWLLEDISDRSNSARALRVSEERYRSLVNMAGDGIAIVQDEIFVFVNPALGKLLGRDEREIVGKPIDYYVHPDQIPHVIARFKSRLSGGVVPSIYESLMVRKDNQQIPVEISTTIITHEGRTAQLMLVHDITKRQQAEAALRVAEERFRAIFENAPTGIFQLDANENLIAVNSELAHMIGHENPSDMLASVKDIVGHLFADPLKHAEFMRRLSEQGYVRDFEAQTRRKDGTPLLVALNARKVQNPESGMVSIDCFVIDIGARKMAERKLIAARGKAEAVARTRAEFMAMISHEIRTPMTGVLGMVRLLLDSEMSAAQRDQLETVQYSGEALLTILNDILDFSRLEAGRLELESVHFDLTRLIDSVVSLMSSRAHEKNLVLSADIGSDLPRHLIGDSTRLRQVLLNLLSNAIKFTHEGQVLVSVSLEPVTVPERIRLKFAVTDTGIGIRTEDRTRLFGHYTQADASIQRRYGGTGLGLAICRKIVTLMGGEINVTSREGEGSTFWFTAEFDPATEAESGHIRSGSEVPALPRPVHVLLAEDNPVSRKVTRGILEKYGHSVKTVTTGTEAIAAVQEEPVDVVLMDIHMPVMDGLEATRAIRSLAEPVAEVPIIALTATALQDDDQRCLAAGMNAYISKPVAVEHLFAVLGQVMFDAPMAKKPPGWNADGSIILDVAELEALRQTMNESELADLLQIFETEAVDCLDKITGATAKTDLPSMSHAAHELKSAAGNFGLNVLYRAAEAVELACRDGRHIDAFELGRTLATHVANAMEALHKAVGK
ncbi:MAG: PAS domain S-box protein, partial [Pseudomonadota bacterium]|nr:PAS domain S-box protein [Pseudomonadota bacterium]